MNKNIAKRRTPEEEELYKKRIELATLENTLAQHELDLATLQAQLNLFLTRYLSTVGLCYSELDEIKAQIAEIEARLNPQEEVAKDKASKARQRAYESAKATQDIHDLEPPKEFMPSERLKKLYRKVAKKIHPDLCTDEKERVRRHQLMVEVNRAYEQGDEERLQSILEEWESRPEAIEGEDIATQLIRLIRKLANVKERIRQIASRMEELKKSDLYAIYMMAKDAEATGKDLLDEMVKKANVDILNAKEQLRKLKLQKTSV